MIEYESLARSNSAYMAELEDAATRVIRSGWYVLGQEVSAFETEFAQYVGAEHCIGVANGLDALILSIEALDLPKGSNVLVASNTYIATILAIVRAGHQPVLVEPDLETFNIDPANLAGAMTSNTRAICVTHLFGKSCRMDAICAFAQEHGLRIIEDCAQSHGAKLAGKMTGTFGDAGCFSFYPTKNLGAIGDAGAVVTNDDALADRLRHTRNYGSKQKYVNEYLGINSRLDEIQAAMLRVKLRHLDEMTEHKLLWLIFILTICQIGSNCRASAMTNTMSFISSVCATSVAMNCAPGCSSMTSKLKSITRSHHINRKRWKAF